MNEIIVAGLCVAGALLVGSVATRLNQRTFPSRPKTNFWVAALISVATLSGLAVGLLIVPMSLIPENQYFKVISAVGITILLGSVELFTINKLPGKWLNNYILDDIAFPFMSLGFACALLLKSYLG